MILSRLDGKCLALILRSLGVYTAVLILGTGFFFFLHHLGNGLPYEQAKQRFSDDITASLPNTYVGYVSRFNSAFTYCQISLAVMAGAWWQEKSDGNRLLVDAVLPITFEKEIAPDSNYCAEVEAVSGGAVFSTHRFKPRYLWGSKAIFAIALRHLSVLDFYQSISLTTYGAYLLLASSLLLLGWRTLLVTSPLIVLGTFFSGIRYFSGVENGIPYLWAVLAAVILTLLLWRQGSARAAPLFCFIAGMVSSYLWLFDGHNFLAIALIGLIGWLGHERMNKFDRVRRVSIYILLYAIGFVLCFAASQATKTIVYEHSIVGGSDYFGGGVAMHLFGQIIYHLGRIFSPEGRDLYGRSVITFWSLSSIRPTVGIALTGLSALALLGAGFFARYQVRRGHPELGRNILWFVGIMLLACVNFLQPNDLPYRASRFMFVPLALCWSCLILSVMDAGIPRWIVRIADRLPWRN